MNKFKQFYYADNKPALRQNILTNNEYVVSVNIHALPGTTLLFNKSSQIIMNATGNFGMDCTDFPITDLQITNIITGNNGQLTYPIIIDILYK